MSDIGFDVIGSVKIMAGESVLVNVSGRCLSILSMLRGENPTKQKTMSLPFPVIKLLASCHTQISTRVNFRGSILPYVEKQKKTKPFVAEVMSHIGGLVDIVIGYLGMDHDIGTVSMYVTSVFKYRDERKALLSNRHDDPFDQFQEIHATIKPWESKVGVDLSSFKFLMKRIIIVFGTVNGPNEETLAVLQDGSLVMHGIVHTEFTGDSAQKMDKKMFGTHVQGRHIYNITFDDGKNMYDPERVSSFMNFTRLDEVRLYFNIIPQKFPMTVTIIGENTNVLMVLHGVSMCRYR
jgi:hypothetical protein